MIKSFSFIVLTHFFQFNDQVTYFFKLNHQYFLQCICFRTFKTIIEFIRKEHNASNAKATRPSQCEEC